MKTSFIKEAPKLFRKFRIQMSNYESALCRRLFLSFAGGLFLHYPDDNYKLGNFFCSILTDPPIYF